MTDDKIDYESMLKDTRSKPVKTLTRDEYPDARAKFLRGVWVLEVSIPNTLRHLFNTTTVRKTAGKTEADYDRRRRSLTNEIYQEFDRRQEEFKKKHQRSDELLINI